MFSGSIPALVTPFDADGRFVERAFRELIEWQISEGSTALVPCGTTGEAATLAKDEHFAIVKVCVDQVRGRVPVIAGAGSNDTRVAAENIAAAKEAGADAALMVPPYYNRPSQEGIFQHFAALAPSSPLPIVLYNVPGRTVTDIQPGTLIRIVEAFPKVFVGVKDASGVLQRVSQHRAALGEGFSQLSGNDDLALAFNAMGGVGCISVTANVAPALCAEFHAAIAANELKKARELNDRLFPLHYAMFSDASPAPVKYALSRVHDWIEPEVRLPLVECSDEAKRAVDEALVVAGVVEG
jgi:4-hydroxy-tetrahydrodipicolinate synthase